MTSFSPPTIVVEDETNLETVHFTLKWAIHDFEGLKNKTGCMLSSGITMTELGMEESYRGRWRICVEPCRTVTMNNVEVKCMTISLRLSDEDLKMKSVVYTGERAVSYAFKLRITTGKLMDIPIYNSEFSALYTFSSDEDFVPYQSLRIAHHTLFGAGDQKGCLKDSCLHIAMDVVIYREPKTTRTSEAVSLNLFQRYQEFLGRQLKQQDTGGDFLLVSNNMEEFHVDHTLLMAHSPVFAAMLTHDSKEKQTSRCEMDDIDAECVEILRDYVYGCETGKIHGYNVEKVLVMADKYRMMDLLAVCELVLSKNIRVDNAAQVYSLASQRNLGTLKGVALKFIRKNMDLETILDESMDL